MLRCSLAAQLSTQRALQHGTLWPATVDPVCCHTWLTAAHPAAAVCHLLISPHSCLLHLPVQHRNQASTPPLLTTFSAHIVPLPLPLVYSHTPQTTRCSIVLVCPPSNPTAYPAHHTHNVAHLRDCRLPQPKCTAPSHRHHRHPCTDVPPIPHPTLPSPTGCSPMWAT
jgi:hypothetical protein